MSDFETDYDLVTESVTSKIETEKTDQNNCEEIGDSSKDRTIPQIEDKYEESDFNISFLERLYQTGEFSDITVKFKSKEFKFHKVLLIAKSGFFKAALVGFSQSSMDLSDTPFDGKIVLALLGAMYGIWSQEILFELLESGVDSSDLLKCVEYFQMPYLDKTIREDLEDLPEENLEDEKVFKKLVQVYKSCNEFEAFIQLCVYIQQNAVHELEQEFPNLPLSYLSFMLENGEFEGTNDEIVLLYGSAFHSLSKANQKDFKPQLYSKLKFQGVRMESLYNLTETRDDTFSLLRKCRDVPLELPEMFKKKFVFDDVKKTFEYPFSYLGNDFRFQFKKGNSVSCFLYCNPHLLLNKIPIYSILVQESLTKKVVYDDQCNLRDENYVVSFRERLKTKTELSRGWNQIAKNLIKNKEYEISMKCIGLQEIN
jgi:hypothetical protein